MLLANGSVGCVSMHGPDFIQAVRQCNATISAAVTQHR